MPPTKPSIADTLRPLIQPSRAGEAAYLILDAARGVDPPEVARRCGVRCQSLYGGTAGDRLADVAPYLVAADERGAVVTWFAERWGTAVGVALRSRAEFAALHGHLQSCCVAQQPNRPGEKFLFRFYDPRVLRAFLPTCDTKTLYDFLGPVQSYLGEDEQGAAMSYSWSARGLVTVRTELDGGA